MSKRPRYMSPFPALELSHEDSQQLQNIAQLFVQDTIAQYEQYLHAERRTVENDRWKHELQKENVRVYSERRPKKRTSQERSYLPAHSMGNDIPTLLVVGTIDGLLHDAMYGAVNPTVDSLRVKTSYVDDNVVNAAVLATIVTPTPADPFRSMSIKWIEIGQPLHIRMVVKNRDMVYLESTGMTQLANGERVGYQLLHSVHFPHTHPLEATTRGNMSVCALYRQDDPTAVDLYVKAYLSPSEGVMRAAIVKSGAEALVSPWRYVHCGRMKKLAWAVQQRKESSGTSRGRLNTKLSDDGSKLSETSSCSSSGICEACDKQSYRFLKSRVRVCVLCEQSVCSACTVKKQLSHVASNGKLQQQEVLLCQQCVHGVTIETDAMKAARDELGARALFENSDMSTDDSYTSEY
uniref:FYVE-type domain-containing protein n=1 Tax=Globisporangium ultimum (strain ATCC 200006 / CBS 805.95 / DAOM BR144) TaxID=431595 RepID=K3W9C7_GLOUD